MSRFVYTLEIELEHDDQSDEESVKETVELALTRGFRALEVEYGSTEWPKSFTLTSRTPDRS